MLRTTPIAFIACTAPVAAQDTNGYIWATIDHADNRATNDNELPVTPGRRYGAVDYEFQMATTEVTNAQWRGFVEAYLPFSLAQGNGLINNALTGSGVIAFGLGNVQVRATSTPGRAADMSWEYAARYVNWLHNGQVNEAWAFESGAYDTSTFTYNPDGSGNHQATRSADATYWIPSRDEWTKAAYYDPNRYGEGEEGYWLYPNQSDTRSINSLLPEDGGEANTSLNWDGWPLDVAQFDTTSYFGLFDLDGGVGEFTDTVFEGGLNNNAQRYYMSNHWAEITFPDDPFGFYFDRIDFQSSIAMNQAGNLWGLRVARAVPSPAGSIVLAGGLTLLTLRRRRPSPKLPRCATSSSSSSAAGSGPPPATHSRSR